MADASGGSIVWNLNLDASKFNAGLQAASSKANTFASNLDRVGGTGVTGNISKVGAAMSAVGRSATYLASRAAIVGAGLGIMGKKALNMTSDFQQNRIAFDTMLGSASKGQKMMKELSDFAKKTPFNLPEVAQGAKGLLAYGLSAEKIIPTFGALGNIASGVGRDKLPQLTLAYGQVRTATKLTGMELRQFTEAGVPLLEELSKQSGKTAAQIKDDMENGTAPSFKEVEKAIFSMSQKGGRFYNLMEKQSKTFAGRMSNIGDSVSQIVRGMLGVDVEGNIEPGSIFDRVTNAAQSLMNWLEANKERIIGAIQGVFDFIINNGKTIAVFVGTVLTYAFATWAVAVISATWPILAVAAAVTGLFLLFQRFRPQIDAVIGVFKKLWDMLKPIRDFVADQLSAAWRDLTSAFNEIKTALAPFMPQLKKLAIILGVVIMIPLLVVIATIALFVAAVVAIIVVVARVIGWFAKLQAKITSVTIAMYNSIKDKIGGAIEFLRKLQDKIVKVFSDAGKWLLDAGKQIISGLVNGIKNAAGAAVQAVKDVGSNIMGAFKSKLGIQSPSKIFEGFGQNITAGLVKGITASQGMVDNAITGLTTSVTPNIAVTGNAAALPTPMQYNIGTINIAKEVDADKFMRRLNRDQEMVSRGLAL